MVYSVLTAGVWILEQVLPPCVPSSTLSPPTSVSSLHSFSHSPTTLSQLLERPHLMGTAARHSLSPQNLSTRCVSTGAALTILRKFVTVMVVGRPWIAVLENIGRKFSGSLSVPKSRYWKYLALYFPDNRTHGNYFKILWSAKHTNSNFTMLTTHKFTHICVQESKYRKCTK